MRRSGGCAPRSATMPASRRSSRPVPRRGYRFIAPTQVRRARPAAMTRRAVSPRLRLVVLPFRNLSDDSREEYFSDGLTEELIAQLGPLCLGRSASSRAGRRWSTRAACSGPARSAEALHAAYLVEGSTRREGTRVRHHGLPGGGGHRVAPLVGDATSARRATGFPCRLTSHAVWPARS